MHGKDNFYLEENGKNTGSICKEKIIFTWRGMEKILLKTE